MRSIPVRSRRLSILAAAALSVGAVACSGEDLAESAVNRAIEADGGEGRVDLDGESLTMSDGDSSVSMGSGELPEGYPANFPVFDPSVEPTIAMAINDQDEGAQRMTASYTFQASAAEVGEWYQGALEAAGFEITEPYSAESPGISFEGHGWTGGVGIFDQGTQASANVHLERPLD